MSENDDELEGLNAALVRVGPSKGFGRDVTTLGSMPYEWISQMRNLLAKYYRSCRDCGTGQCPKCVDASALIQKLDIRLSLVRGDARRQKGRMADGG